MSVSPIRVGFIGLNPDSHWAANAHLPALRSLPEQFTVTGVANSTPESARRTAQALGLPHAFEQPQALVDSPEIDLVVVTVKVPHHFELVSAALDAGKHVYCEWPLGNGLTEARRLAALAQAKGVVAVAGTQARTAPEIQHLRQLIADGYVGQVLSTTLIGSGGNWGASSTAELAYLYDAANGASMQAIPLAHTLAAVREVLGHFGPLDARFVRHYERIQLIDRGGSAPSNTPSQVLAHGLLTSGAALSLHYRGGVSRGTNLLWEINGSEGDIQVTADIGHAQLTQLNIRGARGDQSQMEALMPPAQAYEGLPSAPAARNIARIYAQLALDIRSGSRQAPSFDDAVALHEVVDQLERTAAAHEL
ncbi:MAG: Gfo/Idh/MocA family oxidoreductase [Xanthomonadales bacterium]|nr:Gfo/Idh/MocA family oxidoreductase [Xanthomonadales bacterium]